MNEYKDAYEDFCNDFEPFDHDGYWVDCVDDWFDRDDRAASQAWDAYLAQNEMLQIVSLEEVIEEDIKLTYALEDHVYMNLVNGNLKYAKDEFQKLDRDEFLDYLTQAMSDEFTGKIVDSKAFSETVKFFFG